MGKVVQEKIHRHKEAYHGPTVQDQCNRAFRSLECPGIFKTAAGKGLLYILMLLMLFFAASCSKVTVEVDPDAPGQQIPDDFLGISVEWGSVPHYLGDGAGGLRPTVVTLLKAFEAQGHRVAVRIGGNSQDKAWWNPDGMTPPAGVTIDIGPLHLSTLAALTEILDIRLVLGLNLALDDPGVAANLVNAVYAAIPRERIQAFELGNEPDLYFFDTHHRGLGYGWNAYIADMGAFREGIEALVPTDTPFAAPSLANRSWLANMGSFCTKEKDNLALVTTHIYPFTDCYDLAPGPEALLTGYATAGIGASYRPVAEAAHAAGMAYRMDEINSVSCGGADGVSNVYSSALWGADIAFQLASAGLDGLNFHTPSNYAVFNFDQSGFPDVRPLYYGMRLFSLATASQGRLLPVKVKTPARVHAWATLGEDGYVRVALINLNLSGNVTVSLRVPGRSESASLLRLRAPSLRSRYGLSLGGVTWDGSTDGNPLGIPASEQVAYNSGSYTVPLPALDAVVVTLAPEP